MIDQLRQMAIFAKVIDHGSFRGAASELNLSPSVVSHHISELEAHLGVALIYRSTRKLTLSTDGERLLSATRNMLEAIEEEVQDISGTSDDPSGQLRITMPSVLSHSSLTNAIAIFAIKYPRVKLILDYSDTSKDLIDDGFDLAVRMWVETKETPNSKILFSLRRNLIASAAYLKNHLPIKTPEQLSLCDWVMLFPAHKHGITLNKNGLKKIKVKPSARVYSNDAQSMHKLVLSGLGVAALPEFLVSKDVDSGALKTVLPHWKLDSVNVFAEWPTNAPRKGLIKLLLNELSNYNYDSESPAD